MKRIRIVPDILLGVALAAIVAAGLAGCQTLSFPRGDYAPANGIALQPDGPLQGVVETKDLTVSYGYAVTFEPARKLHLSGSVRSIRGRAAGVTVYLHLLDSTGGVIDSSVLYASGFKPPSYLRRPRTFDVTLALPPGAAAIAFSSMVQPSRGGK
jgi:hypothetical protein